MGDDGANALARALSHGGLPLRVLHLEGNQISAEGAVALVNGVLTGHCPLEELWLADNSIALSASAVRHRKTDEARHLMSGTCCRMGSCLRG